jgi:lipopolysaccharide transport system permease protein
VGQPKDDLVERTAPRSYARSAAYVRDVVLHLARSELSARYRRSVLGWFWAIAPPAAQLLVFGFVFKKIVPVTTDHFLVFLFAGIIAWNWFAAGLLVGADSMLRRDLTLRPGFRTELLPVVGCLVAFVDYLLALPILLVIAAASVGVSASYVVLPLVIAIQFVLVLGFAAALAPLNVLFRDIGHLVGIVLLLGFFLTPVFYSLDQVPDRYSTLYQLNPMAQIIEAERDILIRNAFPPLVPLALTAVGALAVLVAGAAVFARLRHSVADHV